MKPQTRNERTGKTVASIAGRVLSRLDQLGERGKGLGGVYATISSIESITFVEVDATVDDLRALAASCLTQAPDKPKRKSTRTGTYSTAETLFLEVKPKRKGKR